MKSVLIALLLSLAIPAFAQGNLFLATKDGKMVLDDSRYPAKVQPGVAVLNTKCTTCHSLARVVRAFEEGQSMSGLPFNESGLRQFITRKMRRADVNLSAPEAAEVLKVMQYMLEQRATLAPAGSE